MLYLTTMSQATLQVNINDLHKLREFLDKKAEVKVGIFPENNINPLGKSNAEIGLKHETGDPETNLPMRSWLRMPLVLKSEQLLDVAANSLAGGKNPKSVYKAIGDEAVHIVRSAFETGGFGHWRHLADVTIANKGNDEILVEHGYLRDAVKSKVEIEK